MSGKHGAVNPATNDNSTAKSNMMDMWKQSIEDTKKSMTTAAGTAKSQGETKTDLEQKVRSGQAECQTCAQRQYQDESSDGGVSFQAAKHISGATAGVVVMNHEQEHVAAGAADQNKDGLVRQSFVGLEYCKCPECGKTYVKGGVTKTVTRPASYNKKPGGLDIKA